VYPLDERNLSTEDAAEDAPRPKGNGLLEKSTGSVCSLFVVPEEAVVLGAFAGGGCVEEDEEDDADVVAGANGAVGLDTKDELKELQTGGGMAPVYRPGLTPLKTGRVKSKIGGVGIAPPPPACAGVAPFPVTTDPFPVEPLVEGAYDEPSKKPVVEEAPALPETSEELVKSNDAGCCCCCWGWPLDLTDKLMAEWGTKAPGVP